MARARGLDGIALATVGAGALFTWSGIRGASVLATVQDLIQGHAPAGANVHPITAPAGPEQAGGGAAQPAAGGARIAAAARSYEGRPYRWGGATPAGWDCSGMVNWVLNHDSRIAIPGYRAGAFTGAAHGPATGQYLVWSGAVTIARGQVAAGDLCCWATHIGIALDGQQMISALNPALGTAITPIGAGGPKGEPLMIRRVRAA